MQECSIKNDCAFYNNRLINMPITSDNFKIKLRYCYKNPSSCARKMVSDKIGVTHVPDDLLPFNKEKLKDFMWA